MIPVRNRPPIPVPCAAVALALAAVFSAPPALCGGSKSFRVTSYKDFSEGQEEGVLVSSRGEVLPGLATARHALPTLSDDSVRAMVQAPDGTVYLGTSGDVPTVLAFSKGQLRKVAQLPATTWVSALCLLPATGRGGGELLAATAQDGRIFRIGLTGQDGRPQVFAQLKADHVWALSHDPKRGSTYAVTGPGKLWEIGDKGKVTQLFDSGARQILALDRGEDGNLYVGTADDAVLYRVSAEGRSARALYDFGGNEVRALVHRGTTLYAAVNDMQRGEASATRGIRIVTPAAGSAPGSAAAKSGSGLSEKRGKGALYRIDPDGRVEQLHAISDGFFNALQVDEQGNLYAAASTPSGRGKVYLVRPDRTVLTALELKESDVLTLSLGRERMVGTGNSGALYRVGTEPPKDASYLSKVFDGQFLSRWGSVRYSGGGPLRIETRSGNLGKPDNTWSPWQAVGKPVQLGAPGEVTSEIASPQGRYLQVRVGLGAKAVLQGFIVSYQQMNQRPHLTEIQIGEDPAGWLARGPRASGPGPRPRSPVVKLRWKVENPDEDELSYRLYVRRQPVLDKKGDVRGSEAEGWLLLGGPEPLLKAEHEWNTESVPDGVYQARVVASDERANPQELALQHELTSPPFVVDNRRPEILDVKWNPDRRQVSGRAVDTVSPLLEVAYSVDGGPFLPVAARDGVVDEPAEEFLFQVLAGAAGGALEKGAHTLVIRVSDVADNIATAQLVIHSK